MKIFIYGVIFVTTLLLTGCANAGKDQTVQSNELVTLDASASTADRGGKIKRYFWRQVGGKDVDLSNKRIIKPTFTAPNVNKKSRLLFSLTTVEIGGHPHRFRTRDIVCITILPSDATDTIKPVITLNGTNPTQLTVGDTYIELVSANDNKDGNLTQNIVITGDSVDTNTVGTYTIVYNVSDEAGNMADEVKRTVVVTSSHENNITVGDWTRTNPGAGGAFSMIGATASGLMVAGSDLSGVYVSEDNGSTWRARGENNGLLDTSVQALGFDPSDGNTFYAGTTNGVYGTKDGGEHFSLITPNNVFSKDNGMLIESIATSQDKIYITYHSWETMNDTSKVAVGTVANGIISWEILPSFNSNHLHILKLVVHPDNPEIVYALSGNSRYSCSPARVYKMHASNWMEISDEIINRELGRYTIEDNTTIGILDIGLNATNNRLYMTTFNPKKCPYELDPNPDDNSVPMYEYVSDHNIGNVYYYDGGFHPLSDDTNRTGVVVHKQDAIRVIDIVNFEDIWVEKSGTATWEYSNIDNKWSSISEIEEWEVGPNGNPSYAFSLGYYGLSRTLTKDQFNADRIFGTYGFNGISTDGGITFKRLSAVKKSDGTWHSTGLDNIVPRAIDVSDSNTNIVYMGGTDIGLWVSKNHGESWEMRIPYGVDYKQYIWGQTFDNGIYDYPGGSNVATLINDPQNEKRVWSTFSASQSYGATLIKNGERQQLTGLFKSNDYGNSWKLVTGGDMPADGRMYGLSLDKNSSEGNRTLYMTVNGHVLKSVNDGDDWMQKTPGDNKTCLLPNYTMEVSESTANGCGLKVTAIDSKNSNLVYAGGESGLWKSIDGGENWIQIGGAQMEANRTRVFNMHRDLSPTYPDGINNVWEGVFDIKTDPKIADRMYVTVYGAGHFDKGGLYRSDDAGEHWTKVTLPLLHGTDPDRYLRGIAVDPNNSNNIFVSSSQAYHSGAIGDVNRSVGILYSNDAGVTWEFINNNMAWNYAGMMEVENNANPRIWACSPGTGLQYATLTQESNASKEDLKILIPLYSYPNWNDDNYTWQKIIDAKIKHPDVDIVAIVNPSNGHFTNKDTNYEKGIKHLIDADIKVVGYVYTDYGKRATDDIVADIESWKKHYKDDGVSGIFFDETSAEISQLEHYRNLSQEARNRGLGFTIINPGTTTDPKYIDENIFDVVVSYEESYDSFLKKESNDWATYNTPSSSTKLSMLIHTMNGNAIDSLVAHARKHNFTYIYFTEDNATIDGNPWDSVSIYIEQELESAI